MAQLKGKQILGVDAFTTSQNADFSRTASDTEFPSEAAIANTFVKFSDLREERPESRPVQADSLQAADRQVELAQRAVVFTGNNINDEVEVFVNGLRISSDAIDATGRILTLSQLEYDIDRTDELVVRYKSY